MARIDDEPASHPEPDAVERSVLALISPDPEQLLRVAEARQALVARAIEVAREEGIPLARAIVAGSAARGTFVKGRLDIDLFLLFPPETARTQLERDGLRLAERVLQGGETRYAEHPYLRGTFQGFAVDAVPGYAIVDSSRPLSAVDRTPFHQEFLEQRETPEIVGQVRLLKQFLRALGTYGADARTGGFSGYLTELLILRYGSFRGLLAKAQGWRLPVDLRSRPQAATRVPPDVALVLDDPVDPNRNVASALSRRNLALFALAAHRFLVAPSTEAFDLHPRRILDRSEALRRVAQRGTHVSVLVLPRPPLVDDILYPQLKKAERSLADEAGRQGFQVIGTASAANGNAVIAVEVAYERVPAIRVQLGPPPGVDRVGDFLAKWTRAEVRLIQGPYMTHEGNLAVEAEREERQFEPVVSARLGELSLGRDLSSGLGTGAALVELSAAPDSEALGEALAALLDKRLPPSLS